MARASRPAAVTDSRLRRWLRAHRQALQQCSQQLRANRTGTLVTLLVIGVTLALPAALYVLVGNAAVVGDAWRGSVQLTLYLDDDLSDDQGEALATRLREDANIETTRFISRDAALTEFRAHSGYQDVLDLLDENPLPASVVLTPLDSLDRSTLGALRQRLQDMPEVTAAQLDQQWLERLLALLAWAHRVILMLALAISLAVVVIIGNTLRLEIARNRDAIVVMKLIGATDRYIQRPYLYGGLLLGALGGGAAWLLVTALVAVLNGPTAELAALYDSRFRLAGPDAATALAVIGGGLLLGAASALWTVRRHLAVIEPRFSGPGGG